MFAKKKKTILGKDKIQTSQKTLSKKIPVKLETLLEWEALSRPFKKRNKDYYATIGAIVFLLAIIFLFLKEILLILVMISLVFLAYVFDIVKPEKIKHKITTIGIETSGKKYKWENMERFWFDEKWGDVVLHIDTDLSFPSRLMLLLNQSKKEKVKKILGERIQYEKPEKTFMDKSSEWLQKKIPLESSS